MPSATQLEYFLIKTVGLRSTDSIGIHKNVCKLYFDTKRFKTFIFFNFQNTYTNAKYVIKF